MKVFGRNFRGSALFLIASLMFLSAIVRLGLEAGSAFAREATLEAEDTETVESVKYSADGYRAMLIAFQEREVTIATREAEIQDRMKALSVADQAIEMRLAALTEAEEKLRITLALADGAAERDLASLTTVYENMKPKETAALFEAMAPEFAAGFLSRMRPEIAAGVMAGLSPNAAYSISVILAGRNTSVPKD